MNRISRFLIITNKTRDRDLSVTNLTTNVLKSLGASVTLAECGPLGDGRFLEEDRVPEGTECIITIGGDGTIIAAALDTADLNIPIFGINKGTLGYLTDAETGDIVEKLKMLHDGHYTVEERMMLCGKVFDRNGSLVAETRALNDIVLRNSLFKVSEYELSVNSRFLGVFKADGMIVCTPTGSTAYSMSAGGPIIEPVARMMVITPICPHTINTRSVVFSADARVEIRVSDDSSSVVFDGRFHCDLQEGYIVNIRRSAKVTKIIRTAEDSFLSVLGRKFQA